MLSTSFVEMVVGCMGPAMRADVLVREVEAPRLLRYVDANGRLSLGRVLADGADEFEAIDGPRRRIDRNVRQAGFPLLQTESVPGVRFHEGDDGALVFDPIFDC